jgi:2-aminoadipate transaminase
MQFADRLNNVETSAIRELFKLLGKPGIIIDRTTIIAN